MKPAPPHAPTYAPLAGFLFGLLAARLVVPLALYLLTTWIAWRWFRVLGPPDLALLLRAGSGWDAGPPSAWALAAALLLIAAGVVLAVRGHRAQAARGPGGQLVTDGIYASLRHPQYAGCLLIMLGVLAATPDAIGAVLFLIFGACYVGLALVEDRALARTHGAAWRAYAQQTPSFVPRLRWRLQDRIG